MLDSEQALGAHGPLVRALAGFRPRQLQRRMAARIEQVLAARQVLLVEAGTGTGKTFAYLVPALLSRLRVLISTGTRTLQDQLYHRDLPLLAGALGRPVRVALLKGRSNYLCRSRLEELTRQTPLLPDSDQALLARVLDWSLATRSGDLAELAELGESHALRGQLSSTRESCAGTRCPQFARCHVFEARHAAAEADIVVVNHHLLLADLALKEEGFGDLLPGADALIIDEAHQLPDLLGEVFGVSLASRQIELLVTDTGRALSQAPSAGESVATLLAPVEAALRRLAATLRGTALEVARQPLDERALEACIVLGQALREAGEQLAQQPGSPARAGFAEAAERARALAATLDTLSADASAALGARTASVTARGFTLRLLPYEVASRFREVVSGSGSAWVFTSATLAVAGDFAHFAGRLGLEQAETLCLESPFDYAQQALLYLPRALPDPSDAGYTRAVTRAALPLLEAAGGGAFLLFTSHRALREAAELLREPLAGRWPMLVQGSAPREQLLRRFRSAGDAVLLGAASFWEGVDVQGPALRLVLIDRLPFASPDDPVVAARIEHLRAQGGNAFRDYQLPEAVLALKQGVGRLIRSESDRGVVVVCDPRLSARGYGRVFRASLPPMPVVLDSQAVLEWLQALRGAQQPARGVPAAG